MISLKEEVEQEQIEKSVYIDVESKDDICKVTIDVSTRS